MIKIKSGVYGYRDDDGTVKPKTSKDAAFSLPPEEEQRLVRRGVAVYVTGVADPCEEPGEGGVATDAEGPGEDGQGDNTFESERGAESVENARTVPDYSVDMKVDELREIMEQFGLSFKVGMTKADIVAALDEIFVDIAEGDVDGEAPPALTPEEPVT